MAVYRYTISITKDIQLFSDDTRSRESKVRSLITIDENQSISCPGPCEADVSNIKIYYMSDVHLDHKIFNHLGYNVSDVDIANFVDNIAVNVRTDNSVYYHHFNLFAGDTSFEPNVAAIFYDKINGMSGNPQGTFAVLGNHELWAKDPSQSVEDFAKEIQEKWPVHLLQNDVAFINWNDNGFWKEKWSFLKPLICDRKHIMKMPLAKLKD